MQLMSFAPVVEEARQIFHRAETEKMNWNQQCQLYLRASKLFLEAAQSDSVYGDRTTIKALVFLSKTALHKSELADAILVASTKSVMKKPFVSNMPHSSSELVDESKIKSHQYKHSRASLRNLSNRVDNHTVKPVSDVLLDDVKSEQSSSQVLLCSLNLFSLYT